MIITCPSGLTITMRKLKVTEANIMGDKALAQKGANFDAMLTSVWQSTQDLGPYSFPANEPPVWEDVLTGDRFYAALIIRSATHGPDFDFRIACPYCSMGSPKKVMIDWTIQLDQLPLRKLSAADAAIFARDNVFTDLGPDGKQVTFHLMTGRSEKRAQQILKSNRSERLTASLLARVDSVEGVVDRADYLNDLDLTDATALLEMLDSHDCGVDTTFNVECQECGEDVSVELPLDHPMLWSPSKKKTKPSSLSRGSRP
jgi:hypothetical protein